MDGLPLSADEPPLALKLYGRNEAEYVEVNGWSCDIPVNFPGVPVKLKIRGDIKDTSNDADFTAGEIANRKRISTRERVSLFHLYNSAWPSTAHSIYLPVSVIVLAKKKIDYMIKNASCLIFGTILVADEEGHYCILEMMNDTIQCFYDEVSPGDCLLIAGGSFYQSQHFYGTSPFRPDKHLKLTIKLTSYQCRNVYRIFGNSSSFEFPKVLTEDRKLWTPSELLVDDTSDILSLKDLPCQLDLVDVIGVVSHVGRMERYERYNCVVETIVPDQTELGRRISQYNVFRWIEIVDQNSVFPLPIKIYLNKTTWDLQKDLVPGCQIVISFAERAEAIFGYDHLTTSRFSSIYINGEITKYLNLMPGHIQDTVHQTLSIPVVTKLLENNNIEWTVGGSYALPFKSEALFAQFYAERNIGDKPLTLMSVPVLPMERRQVVYLFFRGEIIQHRPVREVNSEWTWTNEEKLNQYPDTSFRKFRKLMLPVVPDKIEDLWYVFTRRLPQPKYNPPRRPNDTRKIFKDMSEANAKYCTSLVMPAGDSQALKELPAHDGMPHFVLDIINYEAGQDDLNRFFALWKPTRYLNFEQMETKLENSKGKEILLMMEIHRVECVNTPQGVGYEVILQDFTTIISKPPELSECQSQSQSE